jgi:hypothetical protein
MSHEQYDRLIVMLGFAIGAVSREGDPARFYRWIAFVNDLNATNRDFTPYEIPVQYRAQDVARK